MAEFTDDQREKLAEKKQAMPDGSYPIRNRKDLKNAIQAYGRSKNKQKTKAWIKKRARELEAEDLLPDEWAEEVWHYGIKGQKWGVRRYQNEDGSLTSTGKKRKKQLSANQKKAIRILGILAASAAVSYAAYRFSTSPKVRTFMAKKFIKNTTIDQAFDDSAVSTIFSKKLNRLLTAEEAERLGLL